MIFHPDRAELAPLREALLLPYVDYCTTVSARSMALSIESATFLWHLCRSYEARSVCDLGSGFSSYVLARYAQEAPWPVTVCSVDDSPHWLDQTRQFMERHNAEPHPVVLWDDWTASPDTYDVILHDYARGDDRNTSMWHAARRLNTPGALLFDDAQNDGHAQEMLTVAGALHLTPVDVHDLTVDMVKRFALVAAQ